MNSTLTQHVLRQLGFASLTPMQLAMFQAVMAGKDVALLSPTGSGKTFAFLLPLLHRLKPVEQQKGWPQAVVISPSRELAQQSEAVFKAMKTPFASMALCGGRASMDAGRKLKEVNPTVVFATPGRFNDHLDRGDFDGGIPTLLVIDEFDKCLELGFKAEMDTIARRLKFIKQTIFTSATLPRIATTEEEEAQLLKRYAKITPLDFREEEQVDMAEKFSWHIVPSPVNDKLETLAKLLTHLKGESAIVFVSHRESVERIATYLRSHKFAFSAYHGGLEQQLRERELYAFRAGSTNILISTDLAARGLDIPEVSAIIHYHLPLNEESFTHRCGRTARWEAEGSVYMILNPTEQVPAYFPDSFETIDTDDITIAPTAPRFASLYLGKGKRDKLSKMDIVGFLCKKGGLTANDIGRIDVDAHHAYVAIASKKVATTLRAVAGEKIKGMKVLIEAMKR